MSEYIDRFVENHIDESRKMLRAIRDLGNASLSPTAPSTSVATEPTRQDDAERRQLTVMFTDLVGSTALSTKLDPEDLRSVIGAYHKCVAETIARFDGFVAKYMGDGVVRISAIPRRTRTMPSVQSGRDWRSSKRSASCASKSRSRCASGSRRAWSWWAI
jgi:class 3 adenylate cyclase